MLHSAVLEDLEPSSTYFYRVGDAGLGLSTVRNFTTPGVIGAEQPLVLGVLGDLGQTNDSRCVLIGLVARHVGSRESSRERSWYNTKVYTMYRRARKSLFQECRAYTPYIRSTSFCVCVLQQYLTDRCPAQ